MDRTFQIANLRVADAMRLFGVSARALRFYEEKGLLQPGRDRHNRRVYDAEARRRLAWITRLRAADLSIIDIHDVLRAEDRDGSGEALALARMEARREAMTAALVALDRAIESLSPVRAPAAVGRARVANDIHPTAGANRIQA
jgi:DNA-binding transcriptional MerR regulator